MAVYYGIKLDLSLSSLKLVNRYVSNFVLRPTCFSPALILQNNSTIEQDLIPRISQRELVFNVPRFSVLYGGNPTRWRIFVLRGNV